MEEILTASEVADRLKVHLMTVYRWISSGRIPVRRLPGGGLRIDAKDVETLLGQDTRRSRPKSRRRTNGKPRR